MKRGVINRLVSISIITMLILSVLTIFYVKPTKAQPIMYLSKKSNLTCGETIWVNVTGLDPGYKYGVWIEDESGDWEKNVSSSEADCLGMVSMKVDIPYRSTLGDYELIVLNISDGAPFDPNNPEGGTETIYVNNTYGVKIKVNGNEVPYLLHNRTYSLGGELELTFEITNMSEPITWGLNVSLLDPEGNLVVNKTLQPINKGKWTPNIVTFNYLGDLPNREVNYSLEIIPTDPNKSNECTRIVIPVKLNVTVENKNLLTGLKYGDVVIDLKIYVRDWDINGGKDLNVSNYNVSVYAPKDGGYVKVWSDYTHENGRVLIDFNTTSGSAGTWYIGTEMSGGYRIDETEKLNIPNFIAYESFEVEPNPKAKLKIESPAEIFSGFTTTINVSAYVSDPNDPENAYYDKLKFYVTGVDAYYNGKEYDAECVIPVTATLIGKSSNNKYAYYEFDILFNKTGTVTLGATYPESYDVYEDYKNKDLKPNITGTTTFTVVQPAEMNLVVNNMPTAVLIDENADNNAPDCDWKNYTRLVTIHVYGTSESKPMNASLSITGCGVNITIDEEDAVSKGYWVADGTYEVEISPKTGGIITIKAVNGTTNKTVTKEYTIEGLSGSVTTSVGDDLEIPVESEEKIIVTVPGVSYGEVHLTYYDENWNLLSCLNDTIGDNKAGNGLNGVYEFVIEKDDIKDGVGYIVVAVKAGNHYMYDIVEIVPVRDLVIDIIEPENATNLSLTVGLKHTYKLKVYDKDGKLMDSISYVKGYITDEDHDKDNPLQIVNFSKSSGSVWQIKDWTPHYAGTLLIEAVNDSGKNEHIGEVSLNVGLATISYSPSSATAGIEMKDLEVEVAGVDANGNPLPTGTKLYLNVEDDYSIDPKNWIVTLDEEGKGTFTINEVGDNKTKINATLLAFFNTNDPEANKTIGEFIIDYPQFTVDPSEIYIGQSTQITIIAKDTQGNPIKGINLTLLPSSAGVLSVQPDPVETDEDGKVILSVQPQASGKLNVTIARNVRYVGGQLTWDNAVVTDTYITVTSLKTLTVTVSPSVYRGQTLTVTVKDGTTPVKDANVEFAGETKKTDSNGEATFTAPNPGVESANYEITVSKTGYITVTKRITVINRYEIIIKVPDEELYTGKSYDFWITAKGQPLAGATVTFNGKTYTSDGNGKVTLTMPSEKGTYTVKATYSNYIDGETTIEVKQSTPGFELITLVVAIGIAFILLRRRKKQ